MYGVGCSNKTTLLTNNTIYSCSGGEGGFKYFFFQGRHAKITEQHWSSNLKPSRSSVLLSRHARLVSLRSVHLDSSSPLHTARWPQSSRPVRSSSQGDTGGRPPPALTRQANLARVQQEPVMNTKIHVCKIADSTATGKLKFYNKTF